MSFPEILALVSERPVKLARVGAGLFRVNRLPWRTFLGVKKAPPYFILRKSATVTDLPGLTPANFAPLAARPNFLKLPKGKILSFPEILALVSERPVKLARVGAGLFRVNRLPWRTFLGVKKAPPLLHFKKVRHGNRFTRINPRQLYPLSR